MRNDQIPAAALVAGVVTWAMVFQYGWILGVPLSAGLCWFLGYCLWEPER